MVNRNRRKLLKYLSLMTGVALMPGCGDVEMPTTALKSQEISIGYFDGIIVLSNLIETNIKLRNKLSLTTSSPAVKQLQTKLLALTEDKILAKIESDFEKGETIDFRGFVFSNTEVALYQSYQSIEKIK